MANLNQLHQRQVKSDRAEFNDLLAQVRHIEDRTRHIAYMPYEVKTQWEQGTLVNIDTDTTLDKIQLAEASPGVYEASASYESYVLDAFATDVKFEKLTHSHTKPAGTTITYSTRSGNIITPDGTWTAWQVINSEDEIQSDNGRYIQFKVELATTNTAVTPEVDSVSIGVWAAAGSQEIFDARGPYKSVAERFDQLDSVYILKVLPANESNEITVPKIINDTATFKVWVNGNFQTEGTADYDSYTLSISGENTLVTFNDTFDGTDVVVCRIEGAGSGVLTVKENRIVDEIPSTVDHITFSLVREPIVGSEEVYVGGIKMLSGLSNDYTVSGKDVIFNYLINESFIVRVTYLYY
jgi:hypothetical protein